MQFVMMAILLPLAGPPAGSGLISGHEILATTFVDLDMGAFPSMPKVAKTTKDVVHVARTGNDKTGNGSRRSPFATIARGLQAVKRGGTVLVHKGNYREVWEQDDYRSLVVDKPGVALKAAPGEAVTVLPANSGVKTGLNLTSDNCLVQGIHFQGFVTVGVLLTGGKQLSNIRLIDLKVTGSDEGIASWEGTVDGLLAVDLKIEGAGAVGFHCGSGTARNWRLERVVIQMKPGVEGSGADAFAVENGDNILLVDVETTGASADGIDTKATRVVLLGCQVHHVGRNGVKLWHGGDVINCLIHHTGADAAVVIEQGPRTRLLHTLVAHHNFGAGTSYNMTFGYDSRAKMQVEIINSLIFNTSGGAYFTPKAKVSIQHSLFFGMQNGMILEHDNTRLELSGGATGLGVFGPGNLVSDPRLDKDFQAKTGGPSVNAAISLSDDYPKRDLAGNPRVRGRGPDLGPYELASSKQ